MPIPSRPLWFVLLGGVFAFACLLAIFQFRHPAVQESLLPGFGKVPEFHLISEDGRSFQTKDLRGHVTIADFIFTSCAGPCPLMSAQMQDFQSKIGPNDGIKLLSFSVDPETDTPDVLLDYAHRFSAVKDKWTFLTGSKSDMYMLTRKGFLLSIEADSDAISHSTKFVLIDKSATIRGYYDSGDDSTSVLLLRDAFELAKE